jgi:hypothetical protein
MLSPMDHAAAKSKAAASLIGWDRHREANNREQSQHDFFLIVCVSTRIVFSFHIFVECIFSHDEMRPVWHAAGARQGGPRDAKSRS